MHEQKSDNSLRAYRALNNALDAFSQDSPEQSTINAAIQRGYFIPEEDDLIWSLVARYLTIRSGFWELINEVSEYFSDDIYNIKNKDDWRYFLIGYASSCQAVKMARTLVEDLATHSLVQRKINEGSPQNRIPRKVFTSIYESLSDADNAIKMQYLMNYVDKNREYIQKLESDEFIGDIVKQLPELETSLHPSQREFIKLRLNFLCHSLKRLFAVGKQNSSFFVLENAGRAIADIGNHRFKRVSDDIQKQAQRLLQAGDVIITRHDLVASNLFLPGYWPHAALYIGSEKERDKLGVTADSSVKSRWAGDICVLEAKKDGVLFRPLSETLAVDELIILRPSLSKKALTEALIRVVKHEGKGYNFDFDFFRSDQLVCTEVVYRAFDGLEDIEFKLVKRAGRFSLSAEDILDLALAERGFKVIGAYGFKGCENMLATQINISELVKNCY